MPPTETPNPLPAAAMPVPTANPVKPTIKPVWAAAVAVALLALIGAAALFAKMSSDANNSANNNQSQQNQAEDDTDDDDLETTPPPPPEGEGVTCQELSFRYDPDLWQIGISGFESFVVGGPEEEAEVVAEINAQSSDCTSSSVRFVLYELGAMLPCYACDGGGDFQTITVSSDDTDWDVLSNPSDNLYDEGAEGGGTIQMGTTIESNTAFTTDTGIEGRIITTKELGYIASGYTVKFVFQGDDHNYVVQTTHYVSDVAELDSDLYRDILDMRKDLMLEVANTVQLEDFQQPGEV
jgi:hypothetical protein